MTTSYIKHSKDKGLVRKKVAREKKNELEYLWEMIDDMPQAGAGYYLDKPIKGGKLPTLWKNNDTTGIERYQAVVW